MITGVAIRNDEMMIALPSPNRHSDCFLYAITNGIDITKSRLGAKAVNQGFITHTGKYLDRVQAAKYLKRVKQQTVFKIGKVVVSEDLW
jgi:hypothetical protein